MRTKKSVVCLFRLLAAFPVSPSYLPIALKLAEIASSSLNDARRCICFCEMRLERERERERRLLRGCEADTFRQPSLEGVVCRRSWRSYGGVDDVDVFCM